MPRNLIQIVEEQVRRWQHEQAAMKRTAFEQLSPRPLITISRQLGAGGAAVAELVAKRLECELVGYRIINEIAKKAEVRKELVDKLDEKTRSLIDSWFGGGLTRDALDDEEFHRLLIGTVRAFAEIGSVVILGRGAGMLKIDRPKVTVRVIAPIEVRIQRVMERRQCGRNEALGLMNRSDADRRRFIKREFDADWDDDLNYDLVINTGAIPFGNAAAIIETAWLRHVTKLVGETHVEGPD